MTTSWSDPADATVCGVNPHTPSDDSVAVVTGAAGGIGSAIVKTLARQGIKVVAVDRVRPTRFDDAVNVVSMAADVTVAAEVERVVSATEADVGPIGYLVNAAGVVHVAEVSALDLSAWADVFAVNTTGVFLMTRAALVPMTARRCGAVVTVSSNAARVPRLAMSAYCASKAATTMFTKCVALEVAALGIRCNVVSPGSTDTDMLRASWRNQDRRAATVGGAPEQFRVGIPLGRIAAPDDIAEAVEFLLSARARHITMHDLIVDGGAALGV
jgi:2,3-dihydro-2,3-dihydroxybenzoate dehydrogenase